MKYGKPPTVGPNGGAGDSGVDGEGGVTVIHDPRTAHVCSLPAPSLFGAGAIIQCECKKKYEQITTFFRSKPKWRDYYGGW